MFRDKGISDFETDIVQDFPLDRAVKKELSIQLCALRKLTGRNQIEQAEFFNVSHSTYKRWEADGPDKFSFKSWDLLISEAERITTKNQFQQYKQMFDRLIESGKHLKRFINVFAGKSKD